MTVPSLRLPSVDVRAVSVPLRRPVVSRVGQFDRWPIVLVDLTTEEGVTGRSYLEPYLQHVMRSIAPAVRTLVEARKGRAVAPLDDFRAGRASLNLVGLEGISLIAVAALDMAAWDALAKAANLPLAVLLGGSLAPVPAYNSNGLWLIDVKQLADEAAALIAEGGFKALKLRLGRERLADDLAAIRAVRNAVGDAVKLMVDFNQGLSFGDALRRCRELDKLGLYWFEEPIAYDNIAGYERLARELRMPVQLGENFYGPRALLQAVRAEAGDYVIPDLMRIGGVTGWLRSAAICRSRRTGDVEPSLPRVLRASAACDRNRALAGMAGLGRPGAGRAVPARGWPSGHSRPTRQWYRLERRRDPATRRRSVGGMSIQPRR